MRRIPSGFCKRLSRETGYDEMIVLRGIRFESHCEHHMAPIIGQAWVGSIPQRPCGRHQQARTGGSSLSNLAQIQERTAESSEYA